MFRRICHARPAAGVFTLLALLAAPAARADHIDPKLLDAGPKLVAYLNEQGYKNVGVLRFRLEQAGKPATFSAGAINGSLADRLESVLVMANDRDEAKAVGVIHNAGGHAAKATELARWYEDAGERAKLFQADTYPLAWGTRKVRPDAFLTGAVRLSPDLTKTTVSIEAFSAQAPATLERVAEFTVDTDSTILRDAGKSFTISRRAVISRWSPAEMDRLIVQKVARRDNAADPLGPGDPLAPGGGGDPPTPNNGGGGPDVPAATPDNIGGVQIRILVAGQDGPAPRPPAGDGKWTVECPDETKPVAFVVKNTTDKKLGVVIRLNGFCTIGHAKEEAANSRKYILKPGQEVKVQGFLEGDGEPADGKQALTLSKFKVLVGEEARAKKDEFADKYGEIAVDVFAAAETAAGDETTVISRGVRPADAKARQSLEHLQAALMRNARLKRTIVKGREVIVADRTTPGTTTNVRVEDFPNPRPVGALSIWLTPRAGE